MFLFRFCPKSIGMNSYPSFSNKSVSISKCLTFLMDSMTISIFFFLSLMMCWLLVVPFPIKGINEVRKSMRGLCFLLLMVCFPILPVRLTTISRLLSRVRFLLMTMTLICWSFFSSLLVSLIIHTFGWKLDRN